MAENENFLPSDEKSPKIYAAGDERLSFYKSAFFNFNDRIWSFYLLFAKFQTNNCI